MAPQHNTGREDHSWALALLAAGAVAVAIGVTAGRLLGGIELPEQAMASPVVIALAVCYAGLLALPFMPGAELGLLLLGYYGSAAALLVWGATMGGLLTAYTVGRLVPSRTVAAALGRLRLRRAQRLVLRLAPMTEEERLAHLLSGAPSRLLPILLRHRYVALALALNLPGNVLLGGGGGLALAAGVSGLYAPGRFVLTAALAVLPLPLAVLLIG